MNAETARQTREHEGRAAAVQRTFAEYLGYRVRSGKSQNFLQSSIDTSLQLLQHAKAEDVLRVAEGLPESHRAAFIEAYNGSIDLAASHSEMTP